MLIVVSITIHALGLGAALVASSFHAPEGCPYPCQNGASARTLLLFVPELCAVFGIATAIVMRRSWPALAVTSAVTFVAAIIVDAALAIDDTLILAWPL